MGVGSIGVGSMMPRGRTVDVWPDRGMLLGGRLHAKGGDASIPERLLSLGGLKQVRWLACLARWLLDR